MHSRHTSWLRDIWIEETIEDAEKGVNLNKIASLTVNTTKATASIKQIGCSSCTLNLGYAYSYNDLSKQEYINKFISPLSNYQTTSPYFPDNSVIKANLNFQLAFKAMEIPNDIYQIIRRGNGFIDQYISDSGSAITIAENNIKKATWVYVNSNVDGEYFEWQGTNKFRIYFSAPKGKNNEYENIGDIDWNHSLDGNLQKAITLIKEGKVDNILNSLVLGVTLPTNPNAWKTTIGLDYIPLLVKSAKFNWKGAI